VLKLKTSDFAILTRSLTPAATPETFEQLTSIALSLRERIGLSHSQRFRLVGAGLSNFAQVGQSDLSLFIDHPARNI
jgi:DNA polymerase-4